MGFPCSTPHFFIPLHHCGSQKSTSQVGIAEFSHPVCNTWAQKDESGWKQSSLCMKVFPVTKWITSCVCLFQFCTISWKSVCFCCRIQCFCFAWFFFPLFFFFVAAASLLAFGPVLGAPLCRVVGGLNPAITPLSRERRSSHETSMHLFSAAGRFCAHV